MCPFYPAREERTGLTIAEVTECELETRVERRGAMCGVRGKEGGCKRLLVE